MPGSISSIDTCPGHATLFQRLAIVSCGYVLAYAGWLNTWMWTWKLVPTLAAKATGSGGELLFSTRLLIWIFDFLEHWHWMLQIPAAACAIYFGLYWRPGRYLGAVCTFAVGFALMLLSTAYTISLMVEWAIHKPW